MSESTTSAVVVDARPAHRLFLFDVDGTLTTPRQRITAELEQFFKEVRQQARIGIVGGSDLVKQIEQLGEHVLHEWDYVFSENGLVAFQMGKELARQSIKDYLGEAKLKQLINFVLHYIADLDIPIKRGTFIEFRAGMLNISPIGRNCSQSERVEFEKYDAIHGIRSKFVSVLQEKFPDFGLKYAIGGQISFDAFPLGWDKTYCLRYLDSFSEIHFFGDKTDQGGNDYEIYIHPRCIGHSVKSPEDTRRIVAELLKQAQAQAQAQA